MKTIITVILLLITSAAYTQSSGPVLVICDVNVITMHKEVLLTHQYVIIEKGIIKSLGKKEQVQIPVGAQLIDGKDKYLMPGLFDMHAHFFYEQGENVNTCASELDVMLANGLTTVRIQCGDTAYLNAKKKVKNGEWRGPDLFVSSPQFVGDWKWPGKVFAEICKTPAEAEKAVKQCKQQGYDEIKITFMVKRDVYDAIIKTAKAVGIKVTGHVGPLVKLPAALQAKEQIEHMDEFIDMLLPDSSYNHGECVSDMNIWRARAWETVPFLDEKKIPALVKQVKNAGIMVTPTNYFFFSSFADSMSREQFMARPDYAFIPEKIKEERWQIRERYWKKAPSADKRLRYIDIRKKITCALWKSGVKLMAGSDSPEWFLVQGFSIHDELETFVKSGLTPYAALQTATVNPAQYLGLSKTKGSVQAGKAADLILLDKNPLENISNTRSISSVIKDGRVFTKTDLQQLLQTAQKNLSGQ